jgi:hypothetical protein
MVMSVMSHVSSGILQGPKIQQGPKSLAQIPFMTRQTSDCVVQRLGQQEFMQTLGQMSIDTV